MRINERDDERGIYNIRITDKDDLWYLYQVIGRGSTAGSLSNRKLESRDDQIRADSQPRVKVFLRIDVEETEFHPFTDALRLKGIIVEGPPDMSGHHTLNLEPGVVLELDIKGGTEAITELLDEAERSSRLPKALALTIDDESSELFRIREYGTESLGRISAGPGGKRYPSKDRFDTLVNRSVELVRINVARGIPIIITGPGFLKETVSRDIRKMDGIEPSDIHVLQSSSSGISGLKEALTKSEGIGRLIEKMRFARESEMIRELMSRIGKGRGATYGIMEVRETLSMGAVEVLLISEDLFREDKGKELMEMASNTGASHMLISTSHDDGVMLNKIGGVAAILRFEV